MLVDAKNVIQDFVKTNLIFYFCSILNQLNN